MLANAIETNEKESIFPSQVSTLEYWIYSRTFEVSRNN